MSLTTSTVRVLIALDVPAEQAANRDDLIESVRARLIVEAGYLDDGSPVMPSAVTLALVDDDTTLDARALEGVYNVGIDGLD